MTITEEVLAEAHREALRDTVRALAKIDGLPVEVEAWLTIQDGQAWAERTRAHMIGHREQAEALVETIRQDWDEEAHGPLPTAAGVRLATRMPKDRSLQRLAAGSELAGYRVYREPGPRGMYTKTRDLITKADTILNEYWADGSGYPLTVRQLYYKLVTTNDVKNNQDEYNRVARTLTEARYLGLISWDMLIDRTRTVFDYRTHSDAASAIGSTADSFLLDKWADQPYRVEVWVEKDAAIGTILAACQEVQVPLVSTRGYGSASGIKRAAERLGEHLVRQRVLVLHIADLDPSGWDMTRDLTARLEEMLYQDLDLDANDLEVRRIALNVEQRDTVLPRDQYGKLLSQVVKASDSRAKPFIKLYGNRCWELDALPPEYLQQIIRDPVLEVRDGARWAAMAEREAEARTNLRLAYRAWDDVLPAMKTRPAAIRRSILAEAGAGL